MIHILQISNCRRLFYSKHALPDQEITVRRPGAFFVLCNSGNVEIKTLDGCRLEQFDVANLVCGSSEAQFSYVMADHLRTHHVPFLGLGYLSAFPYSKIAQAVRYHRAGVPHPQTLYVHNPRNLIRMMRGVSDVIQYPIVLKRSASLQGRENYRLQSERELREIAARGLHGGYIIQNYIPNAFDYRILVLGGKAVVVIKRTRFSDASHLNNVCQGANASLIDASTVPALLKIAEQAASAVRMDYTGVDVVTDQVTGLSYVLEANSKPATNFHIPGGIDSEAHLKAVYSYASKIARANNVNL